MYGWSRLRKPAGQFVQLLVGRPQAGHAVGGPVAPQVDVLLVEVAVEVGEEGCGVAVEGAPVVVGCP